MDFLGIGPLELLLVLLIALIVLGPNDMIKTGRTIGKFMRNVVTHPNWRIVQETSQNLRSLPTRLMREASMDDEELERISKQSDIEEDLKQWERDVSVSSWTTPPAASVHGASPLIPPSAGTGDSPPPKSDSSPSQG